MITIKVAYNAKIYKLLIIPLENLTSFETKVVYIVIAEIFVCNHCIKPVKANLFIPCKNLLHGMCFVIPDGFVCPSGTHAVANLSILVNMPLRIDQTQVTPEGQCKILKELNICIDLTAQSVSGCLVQI
ncbi:hypothetical protein SDC9_99668 [bioreactor metagenome]|uniref:Uncharacterized protein n=1 Tax=bioreactor metagenome TaxID=1076179 RepID=A0A645ATM6_9ZZZZ